MGEFLANETSQLQTMSSVTLIMVVLLIVVTFCLLFFVYYKYYSKCIDNNLEDDNIKNELINDNKKYFSNVESIINNKFMTDKEKNNLVVPFSEHLRQKQLQQNRTKTFLTVIRAIFYIIFIGVFVLALVVKFQGNLFYIKNKAGLVILTNSMQTVHENNGYIKDNNITNQIAGRTFIVVEKVQSEDDIKLYDVIAFKDNQNKTIVHRVIEIATVDGHKQFKLRGDANKDSGPFETNVTFDRIVGKWTGEKNFVVGVLLTYLSSNFGIITIVFAIVAITIYEIYEKKINKKIGKRQEDLSLDLDKQIKNAIKTGTQVYFVNVDGKGLVIHARTPANKTPNYNEENKQD